jgi:hypothetical protein
MTGLLSRHRLAALDRLAETSRPDFSKISLEKQIGFMVL